MARTRSPQFNFRVRQDPNTQEPLSMDLLLKGAKPPNNIIRVFLDPSVWGKVIKCCIDFHVMATSHIKILH